MFLRTGELAGDLNIHLTVDGPEGAPAFLLLHALGATGAAWDGMAAELARSYRVIRPDLRGHGLTEVTQGPYSIDMLARDALAVLDALSVDEAHVAGISLGGMVAQMLAAIAPARVRSLILCDTGLAMAEPSRFLDRAALARAEGMALLADQVLPGWVTENFLTDPAAHGLYTMLCRTDPEGYAAACEALSVADLSDHAEAILAPSLVLVGDQDRSTPIPMAEALRDRLGAAFTIIENAAHMICTEQPGQVVEAIHRFIGAQAQADALTRGLTTRRAVMGEEFVQGAFDHASPFERDFQTWMTEAAWGGPWSRPGLDRRTRSLITLAVLATLRAEEEFKGHCRATRNTGASPGDVAETLMHVACYAGIPAANAAMRIARAILPDHSGA
ncbi:3-oxoadipate enol-lactonase [Granulibacter bethesdensis]|uniref:bifunctional 3-oxoadipate enol-lactonase/4-carboxymuconolactone decarboxylase PcaDC n=1 Tax=Granulibacter bethesdensis TaxID=364410 RepID=UPI00090B8C28|nr:alpha/beta fold hydrolase [Granulibacter bethesdensis]APH56327.1 3-oxoadipate enol-lactonase [Granulibacter bethesdensis]